MTNNLYNATIYFNHKLLLFFKVNCVNVFQNVLPEKQGNFIYNREVVSLDFKLLTLDELQNILQYCDTLKPTRLVVKYIIEKQ